MLGTGHSDLNAKRTAWRLAAPVLLALGVVLLLGAPANAIFSGSTTISADGVMASQQRIATDSHDNALAVWTEGEGGARRVQAAFRPADGDFEALGPLSAEGGDADQPLVVFDEHDNALVVWTRYVTATGLGEVQAAFRPAGGTFGAPQTISAAEPGVGNFDPQVDIDESATVVWTRESEVGELSVQAAFRPKDGSFGAPQTLSGPGNASEPQVAVDERGNSLAVWTGDVAGAPAVESAFRARTGDWAAPVQVSPAGYDAFTPRVAFDGHSNAIAVWTADADGADPDDPNFIQAALRPEGGSFGAAERISADFGTAYEPQVAFDQRDNALVAWTRIDGASSVIEASFHAKDGGFEVPEMLTPIGEDAFEPRLAVDESAAVVWTQSTGSSVRVQGAFRRKGGTFGAAQTLSAPGEDSFEPTIAMDRRGNALAMWTHNVLPDFPVVEFAFRPRTGSFTEPGALSAPAPAGAFQPQIATDRWSNAIAVWTVDSDVTDDANPTWVEAAFAGAGGEFDPPVRLSNPSTNAFQPRVAFESDGDAVVTWTAEDAAGNQRVNAAFRPAGTPGFLAPTTLSPAGSDAFDPQVAAGHGTVVVWSRVAGANVSVEASVKPDNDSFLPVETVSDAGEDAYAPQVAVGKEGTAATTWYVGEGDGVKAAIGRTSPAGFGAAATLSTPGMAASEPQIAVDDRGNALALWTGGDRAFIQAAFRPRGAGFGASQDVATDNVYEPQVAFDESGNAIAAWTRVVSDIGEIETAFRPRGGTFGDPDPISDTGQGLDNFSPRIAADDSAAIVWTAQTASGFLRVQSAFRPKDGLFGSIQTLTDPLLYAFEPQVAVDERGNVRAVWTLTDQVDSNQPPAPSTIQSAFRPRI